MVKLKREADFSRGFSPSDRYIGLFTSFLTVIEMNAIRLFAWFEGIPFAKTRVSSFARLAPDYLILS